MAPGSGRGPPGVSLSPIWRRRKGNSMSRLVPSHRGPATDAGVYVPSQSEIEAKTAEFRAKHLEDQANAPDPREEFKAQERQRARKSREAKRAKMQAADDYAPKYRVPVPAGGPVEMSKADICNVEFLQMGDLDFALDAVVEAASAQHEMEDAHCRWTLGGNPDDFDLGDYDDEPTPPPFKAQRPFKPAGAFNVVR